MKTLVNNWVWTELTESLKPERKADSSVPVEFLTKGSSEYYPHKSWVEKGYVKKIELKEDAKKMAKIIQFPADRIEKGTHAYYPEMKEQKPNAQMEASLSYGGSHYFIDTTLELKGRGITFRKQYISSDLTSYGQRKVGWNSYQVTRNAYKKLEEQYSISKEVLLD